MNLEFNTAYDTKNISGLSGWFDGFCPSNGIADDLEKQVKNVLAQKTTWDVKFEELKNGKQASDWESAKQVVANLEKEIKKHQQLLNQEKAVADALGIEGLGAWCNGAASRRQKAETALRQAEKSLGEVKGAFETLERQQIEGLREANKVAEASRKTLEGLKKQIEGVKQRIQAYKEQRDKEKIELEKAKQKGLAQQANQKVKSLVSKENMPMVLGAVALVGVGVYVVTKKKK